MITISTLFGKTITIANDGVTTVKDCLSHYYQGERNIPKDIKVALGGQDVSDLGTPVRDNDVILIRTGQMAEKRQLSGATIRLLVRLG